MTAPTDGTTPRPWTPSGITMLDRWRGIPDHDGSPMGPHTVAAVEIEAAEQAEADLRAAVLAHKECVATMGHSMDCPLAAHAEAGEPQKENR